MLCFSALCFAQSGCPPTAPAGSTPPPPPSFNSLNTSCNTFQFAVNSPNSAITYSWSFGGSGTSVSHTFDPVASNTIPVTLTATIDSSGCSASSTQNITAPVLALLQGNFTPCNSGIPVGFTNYSSIGTATIASWSLNWGDGPPISGTGTPPPFTHTYSYGIFTLSYTITTSTGCADTFSETVSNISNPTIGTSSPPGGTTGYCGPKEYCIAISGVSGNDASTIYTVNFGDSPPTTYTQAALAAVLASSDDSLCHIYNSCTSSAGFTFLITAQNPCGTTQSTISPVSVGVAPVAAISGPTIACSGQSVTFQNSTQLGCNTDQTTTTFYTWHFSDDNTTVNSTGGSVTHTYSVAGTFTVQLIATNSMTCGSDTTSHTICVTDPITPSFTLSSNTICVGNTVSTDNTTVAGICGSAINYQWSASPSSGVSFSPSNTAASPIITFTNSGTVTVTLTIPGSCGGTFSQPVTVTAPPTVNLDSSYPAICSSTLYTFPTGSGIFGGGYASGTITWDFGGVITATGATPDPISLPSGCYTVTVTASNSCGTATDPFTVNAIAPAEPSFTYTLSDPQGCAGTSGLDVAITNTSTPFNCDITPPTYEWSVSPSEGVTFNPNNTAFEPTITFANPDTPDTFYITLTMSPPSGISDCSATATQTITVLPMPTVSIEPIADACESLTITPNITFSNADLVMIADGINSPYPPPAIAVTYGPGDYTISVTATNDCVTITESETFTVSTMPDAVVAGPDFSVCQNLLPYTLTGSPAGGTWSGIGISGNSFIPSSVGTDTLVYTVGTGACVKTDTLVATVLEVTNVTASYTAICLNGGAVQLNSTPASGVVWSGPDAVSSSGLFTPTDAGSFPVTVSYTNPVGCTDTEEITVTVEGIPPFAFNPPDTICAGDTVDLEADFSGGDCKVNYGVNPDEWLSCAEPYAYAQPGPYTIMLEITTPLGCDSIITDTIFVTQPATLTMTHDADNSDFQCSPLTVTVNTTVDAFGSPFSGILYWGDGDSIVIANSPETHTHTYQGTDITEDTTFLLTFSASGGCGNVMLQDSVKIKPQPQAVIAPNVDQICSGTPQQFINMSVGNPDTMTVDFGDGSPILNLPNGIIEHTYINNDSVPVIFNLTLIVENECGSDTLVHPVTVYPNDVSAFFNIGAAAGCAPFTVTVTNNSTPGAQLLFFVDGVVVSSGPVFTYTFTEPGTHEITLEAQNCGTDTHTQTITLYPPSSATDLTFPNPVCAGAAVQMEVLFSNPGELSTVQWEFGNGGTSNLNQPTHVYEDGGDYIVTATVSTFNYPDTCITTLSRTITVLNKPEANFVQPVAACSPLTVIFDNDSFGDGSLFFEWDFGDGNTSIEENPIHTFFYEGLGSATFPISLIVTNSAGCSDTVYNQLAVYGAPQPGFTMNPNPAETCDEPITVQLTSTATGANGYQYVCTDGQISYLNQPSFSFTDTGTYIITQTVMNPANCLAQFTDTVFIHPQPVVSLTSGISEACVGDTVVFTASALNSTTLIWNFGEGAPVEGGAVMQYVYTTPGTYSVSIEASYLDKCFAQAVLPLTITIHPTPVADFTYTAIEQPYPHGEIQFTNLSVNADSYIWSFGDGQTSTEENPNHRYYTTDDRTVMLYAENQFGCKDSIAKVIPVNISPPGLYVPNAFTPNSGPPDLRVFLVKGVLLKEYDIWIYDLWGGQIFHNNSIVSGMPDAAASWNGNFPNGEQAPQGSYVWKIRAVFEDGTPWKGKTYDNGKTMTEGTVTVIR